MPVAQRRAGCASARSPCRASSSSRKFMRRCGGSTSSRNAVARHRHAAGARQRIGELRVQRTAARLEQRQHARHGVRHRHEVHAQVLRQRAHQRRDLLVEQAGHQPAEGLLRQLVQHMQRHDAPRRRRPRGPARSDSAAAPPADRRRGDREAARPRARHRWRRCRARSATAASGSFASASRRQRSKAAPVEMPSGTRASKNSYSRLSSTSRSTRRPFCCRYSVSSSSFRLCARNGARLVVLHPHQRMADEQLARRLRIDALEGHAPAGRQRQPEQRRALVDRGARGASFPVRFVVLAARPDARPPARSTAGRCAPQCAHRPWWSPPARR